MEMRRLAGQEQLMDSVCEKKGESYKCFTRISVCTFYQQFFVKITLQHVPFISYFFVKSRVNINLISAVFLLQSRGNMYLLSAVFYHAATCTFYRKMLATYQLFFDVE